MSDLISLEAHNQARMKAAVLAQQKRTGIACPRCGRELVDRYADVVLTSCPPMKDVVCNNCGFTGHRFL